MITKLIVITHCLINVIAFIPFANLRKKFLEIYEDATLDPPGLIRKYGYPCEVYDITTEDGYIIQVHRIPHGKHDDSNRKIPVIVQHGLGGSSADFLLLGPGKALAYLFADQGYDVWLPNSRDKQYWSFSFHEIGIYDYPAIIDFVLNKTNNRQLFHVGHSQGTTAFYVMASEKPQYNDKIIAQFSLAPTAYVSNIRSFGTFLIAKSYFLTEPILRLIGDVNINVIQERARKLAAFFCLAEIPNAICSALRLSAFGFNWKEYNRTLTPIIIGHANAGFASNQMIHYVQEVNSGRFCQFDYGIIGNLIRYNSFTPPSYNLTKISASIYLFYSDGDWVTDPRDVLRLNKELINVKVLKKIEDRLWSHNDYIIGINAKTRIYDKILCYMSEIFT